jgi:hypothetical protein
VSAKYIDEMDDETYSEGRVSTDDGLLAFRDNCGEPALDMTRAFGLEGEVCRRRHGSAG